MALTADARALLGERAEPPEVVVWSMRGLLFLADRATVLDQVRSGLGARTTVVVSDAVASLVGAVGGIGPGAVVAAGTGAVAFGTDFDEHWNRVDGWGHVLGDVGSGAWIGLAGLRAALRQHDGMGDGSAGLLAAAVERFGPAETWPRQVMTSSDAPERLAGFAPAVCELAPSDPVAARVCVQAGRGLAEALLVAARGLASPRLVATGGVLGAAPVTDALDARLAEAGRRRSPASGSALDGALLLGQHVLEAGSLPEHPAYLLVG
jgi:N-acetylglucosamine kinase-like BadF-type ATPase